MRRILGLVVFGLIVTLGLGSACGGAPDLNTRTFELQYLNPGEAVEMVRPYVYEDRPDAPGLVSGFGGGITVRETDDNLRKIERVLEEYDRAKPGVRLMFQIIAADGPADPDPRIGDVEAALRELFRFEGYRLVAEAQMAAMEGSGSSQMVDEPPDQYHIAAEIGGIRSFGSSGSVELHVELATSSMGRAIQTTMTVPVGHTVVLGSAKPSAGRPTIILTVRPEFVTLPEPTS